MNILAPYTLIYLELWSDQSKHHDRQSIRFGSTNSVSASMACINFFLYHPRRCILRPLCTMVRPTIHTTAEAKLQAAREKRRRYYQK